MTAIVALAAQHGLTAEPQPDGTLKIVNADAKAEEAKRVLAIYGRHYGLEADDYGATFISQGRRFKLTGVKPSRPSYPISAECLSTGKGFKFPRSVVAQIAAQRTARPAPAPSGGLTGRAFTPPAGMPQF
jgi:hypothetical protein